MSIAEKQDVTELIALAKREDLGTGDLSSQLLADATERVAFALTVKQPGILAGCEIAQPVLAAYDGSIEIAWSSAMMYVRPLLSGWSRHSSKASMKLSMYRG